MSIYVAPKRTARFGPPANHGRGVDWVFSVLAEYNEKPESFFLTFRKWLVYIGLTVRSNDDLVRWCDLFTLTLTGRLRVAEVAVGEDGFSDHELESLPEELHEYFFNDRSPYQKIMKECTQELDDCLTFLREYTALSDEDRRVVVANLLKNAGALADDRAFKEGEFVRQGELDLIQLKEMHALLRAHKQGNLETAILTQRKIFVNPAHKLKYIFPGLSARPAPPPPPSAYDGSHPVLFSMLKGLGIVDWQETVLHLRRDVMEATFRIPATESDEVFHKWCALFARSQAGRLLIAELVYDQGKITSEASEEVTMYFNQLHRYEGHDFEEWLARVKRCTKLLHDCLRMLRKIHSDSFETDRRAYLLKHVVDAKLVTLEKADLVYLENTRAMIRAYRSTYFGTLSKKADQVDLRSLGPEEDAFRDPEKYTVTYRDIAKVDAPGELGIPIRYRERFDDMAEPIKTLGLGRYLTPRLFSYLLYYGHLRLPGVSGFENTIAFAVAAASRWYGFRPGVTTVDVGFRPVALAMEIGRMPVSTFQHNALVAVLNEIYRNMAVPIRHMNLAEVLTSELFIDMAKGNQVKYDEDGHRMAVDFALKAIEFKGVDPSAVATAVRNMPDSPFKRYAMRQVFELLPVENMPPPQNEELPVENMPPQAKPQRVDDGSSQTVKKQKKERPPLSPEELDLVEINIRQRVISTLNEGATTKDKVALTKEECQLMRDVFKSDVYYNQIVKSGEQRNLLGLDKFTPAMELIVAAIPEYSHLHGYLFVVDETIKERRLPHVFTTNIAAIQYHVRVMITRFRYSIKDSMPMDKGVVEVERANEEHVPAPVEPPLSGLETLTPAEKEVFRTEMMESYGEHANPLYEILRKAPGDLLMRYTYGEVSPELTKSILMGNLKMIEKDADFVLRLVKSRGGSALAFIVRQRGVAPSPGHDSSMLEL